MRNKLLAGTTLLLVLVSGSFAAEAQPKKKLTLQDLLNSGSSQESPTVAGVRGLDETKAGIDTKARDFAAIDRLDLVVIHDDEVTTFINQGHLK